MTKRDLERFDLQKELAKVTRERDILKKALCQSKRIKYFFIKEHSKHHKVQELCRVLNVSASGYYKLIPILTAQQTDRQ